MAKFQFRYETVLRQRQCVEDERQRELAKVLRQRMIVQNQLAHMQQTIRESRQNLSDTLVGKVNLDRVGQFARYSAQSAMRAQQIAVELARLEKQVETARARLAEAMRQRKAMELLRDREHARWKQEQQRRETAELDEIALQGYVRSMAEVHA